MTPIVETQPFLLARVELKTDKTVYVLGENATITLTNIGNNCVEIGVILWVIIYAYLQPLLGDLDGDVDGDD